MKEIKSEIDIQASPEKIWQVLTALDQYQEWNPFLHHAAGKVEMDAKVNVTFIFGSRDMTLHCTVVKFEPNHELHWRYHVGFPFLYQGEHCFTLEPAGEGRVHFIDKEIFTGLLVPLLVKEDDTGGFVAMDKALKAKAEQSGKDG